MNRIAWWMYYAVVYLMVAGIRISGLWNAKSRAWIQGRRDWRATISGWPPKTSPRIWFHVSSLGEFEQARPVIDILKRTHPSPDIILTFFSPSGYTLRSGYGKARVMYLPADLPGEARAWIRLVRPDIAVFVKYDLWPGFLKSLNEQKIPTILISAHWIPGRILSSWSIPLSNVLLKGLNRIFFQKTDHIAFFAAKGFHNLAHAGDTRIDRSLELPKEASARIPPALIQAGPFDLVAGSTWPADEALLAEVIQNLHLKVILAPHDVSASNIQRLLASIPSQVTLLSELKHAEAQPRVILVDSIGLLAYLYGLGRVAYIGGGFGSGIHNILEPMSHQRPVIFGPRYRHFPEAADMVRLDVARSIKNTHDLTEAFRHFARPGVAESAGQRAFQYLQTHAGASTTVANYIQELIPFGPQHDHEAGIGPGATESREG